MSKTNGRTCVFCESPKVVEAKPVCPACLKKCAACWIVDDWDKCVRLSTNKRPRSRCGEILTEYDFSLCRRCNTKKRTGYYYCDECKATIKKEQDRNGQISRIQKLCTNSNSRH